MGSGFSRSDSRQFYDNEIVIHEKLYKAFLDFKNKHIEVRPGHPVSETMIHGALSDYYDSVGLSNEKNEWTRHKGLKLFTHFEPGTLRWADCDASSPVLIGYQIKSWPQKHL